MVSESDGAPDDKPLPRPALLSPREALTPEPAPPKPPRRSRSARHPVVSFLNGVITLLVLFVMGLGGVLYFGKTLFDQPGPLARDVTVMIPTEAGTQQIAEILATNEVIANPYIFLGGAFAFRLNKSLKAGEYEFKAHMSARQVLDLIVSGKGILHTLTIPEGLTSQQIVQKLNENDLLTGSVARIPPEGSLLPETYKFSRRTARQELVSRMQKAMQDALDEVWTNRRPGVALKSPAELLTLASIVEKETGLSDERPRIAAVFLNRLQAGMRLQSDPTIIYGIAGGAGPLGRPLRKSEIEAQTPYNTYQIDGLPPGPIANPGRASLVAVANPSVTKDLYFVADGSGGHAFAETLDAHNRNVKKWRELQQQGQQDNQGDDETTRTSDAPPADASSAPADPNDPLGVTDPSFKARGPYADIRPTPRPDQPAAN